MSKKVLFCDKINLNNMKKTICLLVASVVLSTASFASFPFKKDAPKQESSLVIEKDASDDAQEKSFETNDLTFKSQELENQADHQSQQVDTEWLITLLLCLLLGGIAAHRWYAGKPIGWNILFILTFGGFGIWYLVDLIMILTKRF